MSRRLTVWAAAMAALLAVARLGLPAAHAKDLVTLTMVERMGLARSAEPIVIGVPLPEGAVRSADELSVQMPDGKPVAADILPVARWPRDGSLRWAHLYFLGDCPAGGQAEVKLVQGAPAALAASNLKVQDAADAITVSTGPLKFVVRKKGFNLIDQAWIDGRQVVASHKRGGVLVEDGTEFTTANDPAAKVAVVESSPGHVLIKAAGCHANADASDKRLNFTCYLLALNDSPVVKVTYTFTMAQGDKRDGFVPLSDLRLELPTTLKTPSVLFGAEGGAKSAKLAPDGEAFVYASDSDTIAFGGAVSGESKGKSAKPRRIGWADLSDGAVGLAGGVRWFWQMHPKSVEASGDGTLKIGLMPARFGRPIKIYSGVSRTHTVQLVFHGAPDAGVLAGRFAGLEEPLRPFAPPHWYCQDTWAFGKVVDGELDHYRPEYRAKVDAYAKHLDACWEHFNRRMDGKKRGGMFGDDYGLLDWGDNFIYAEHGYKVWNGHYYDYPHVMLLAFIRSGDRKYFDHFEPHALHLADVHTVHDDPKGKGMYVGASRYCAPPDHVRIEDGADAAAKGNPVYVSNTFNHHKTESLFESWCLLADPRIKDAIDEIGDYVLRYKGADRSSGQPRGPSFLMMTLCQYCQLTGEQKYRDRLKEVFDKNKGLAAKEGRPHYQIGFLMESAYKYYEQTADPAALEFVRGWADRYLAAKRPYGPASVAFALLAAKTGEPKYLQLALDGCPDQPSAGDLPDKEKDYAIGNRSQPYLFYYFSTFAPAPADAKPGP